MRKTVMAIVAVMLSTLTAQAQQHPMLLSDTHAMVRTTPTGGRLLLLPVEEKEENAHVRIVKDNQLVKTLNVRLAVDRVDYLVPLQLDGATLLDIQFQGNKRQTGAIKDYVCWREMKRADTFDTANREHFRPLYHHTPQYGWMNDPNGMFYMPSSPSGNDGQAGSADGIWHLYYQYNPYGSQWENMTWGHSTTRDLVHWEAQPLAIEPDALGAIFSGSCVVVDRTTSGSSPIEAGSVVAMYTSAGAAQTQSVAVSKDGGQTFQKFSGNPVLTANAPDFRDPKMFWNENIKKWNLILAVGQEMQIFTSSDLRQWHYESSFGKEIGCHDGVWECPDLMRLPVRGTDGHKWLLICNINPGGPFGGSATQYFVGDFDGRKFTCEHKDTRWMDYGKDHYATVTFDNAPEGRRVALAWMSNWQYANQVPTKQFRSANSVPRDLALFEHNGQTYVSVTPSKELLALRSSKPVKKLTEACEVVVDMKGATTITLSNQQGEQVVVSYTGQTLSVDRTKSGDTSFSEHFAAVTTAPTYGNIRQLRLFIDRCSIEVFDADGKAVLTNLVFPTTPYTDIKATNKAKVTIYDLNSK